MDYNQKTAERPEAPASPMFTDDDNNECLPLTWYENAGIWAAVVIAFTVLVIIIY